MPVFFDNKPSGIQGVTAIFPVSGNEFEYLDKVRLLFKIG
jgi:hypothetical protein